MDLKDKYITLVPYTKERFHEFYKHYTADPLMTEDHYNYDDSKVDMYYKNKVCDVTRIFFAICYEENIIGEIQLKRIDFEKGCGTMSIVLTNDTVKNKGFGTIAERLLIDYALDTLKLRTIYADAIHRNTRSKHVLEKIGFVHIYEDEFLAYYKYER